MQRIGSPYRLSKYIRNKFTTKLINELKWLNPQTLLVKVREKMLSSNELQTIS